MPEWKIIHGDCLDVLKGFEDESVDALVTDPPAGISMMNKAWDGNKGGRDKWIEWLSNIMKEALRVLKPGAHGLVWSLPRTSHWTGMALEKAGFEIRDKITHYFSNQECAEKFWASLNEEQRKLFLLALPDESGVEHLFGSGFAKSLDISKKMDKHFGAEREVVGKKGGRSALPMRIRKMHGANKDNKVICNDITAPATEQAKQWEGWGTALSPGAEHWWLVRKPFKGTVVNNVLEHGVGGINVDESRIGIGKGGSREGENTKDKSYKDSGSSDFAMKPGPRDGDAKGRWPKNVIFSHHSSCKCIGKKRVKGSGTSKEFHPAYEGESTTKFLRGNSYSGNHYGDLDGMETVEDWECAAECNECGHSWKSSKSEPGKCPECRSFDARWLCPVKALDIQANNLKSGGGIKNPSKNNPYGNDRVWQASKTQGNGQIISKADEGGASRYFKVLETENWHCAAGCLCGHIWATEKLTKCPECGCRKTKWICAVKLLNEQSGELKSGALTGQIRKEENKNVYGGKMKGRFREVRDASSGSASRFFYCSKASTAERTCDGTVDNKHPTLKSTKLMRYLCKLATPPGGVILDPFCGSGSTGIAALAESFGFIGIEKDEEFVRIARERIKKGWSYLEAEESREAAERRSGASDEEDRRGQLDLF